MRMNLNKSFSITLTAIASAMLINGATAAPRGFAHGGPQQQPTPQQIAEHLIERLDDNGDGLLSLDEFGSRDADRQARAFERLDADGDELLSPGELEARHAGRGPARDPDALRACIEQTTGEELPQRPSAEERFAAADTNADGFIDRDEFAAAGASRLAERFFAIDANADSALDLDELAAAFASGATRRDIVRSCRTEQEALDDLIDA